jgi:2,5-furandicarboxylate decarboxylase 1
LATRMQADKDVNILKNTLCNRLDPSSDSGFGAKMLIDATKPQGFTAERIAIPEDARRLARYLLDGNVE